MHDCVYVFNVHGICDYIFMNIYFYICIIYIYIYYISIDILYSRSITVFSSFAVTFIQLYRSNSHGFLEIFASKYLWS